MSEEQVSTGEKKGKNKPATGGMGMLAAGFIFALVVGWLLYPAIVMSSKPQPINFNHKVHGEEGAGLTCDSCHAFREDGSFAGVPKLGNCVQCHESAQGENPEEARLIEEYITPGKQIPWRSYAYQPLCVFFSHAAHVKVAHLGCTQCHPDMSKSTSSPPVKVYRISGYSKDTMSMEDCEDCHAKKGTSNACFVCHK